MFGHVWAFSAAFAAQLLLLMVPKFPPWPHFSQSYADSGILRTYLQMVASPTQKEAGGCFHTAGRVWGVSSGSATLFVSCEATECPRLQEDAFQGVWGQPTWLHRWMTVRRWAMCLLGAFCSGRGCIWYGCCRRNIWCILGGEAIHKFCLISVSVRILPCLLNLQCQLMSTAGTMIQWYWMVLVQKLWFIMVPK